MKYLPFFILTTFNLFGQNQGKEFISLTPSPANFELAMKITNPSDEQMDSLENLTNRYCEYNKDTCLLLIEHFESITKKQGIQLNVGRALLAKGVGHHKFVGDSIGMEYVFAAREILEKEGSNQHLALAESQIATYYFNNGGYEESISHSIRAMELAKITRDTQSIVKSLMGIGAVYVSMKNLKKAVFYLDEAIKYLSDKDILMQANVSANQAIAYRLLGRKYSTIADTTQLDASVFRDSASFYFKKGLLSAEQSLEMSRSTKDITYIINSLTTLNILNNELGYYKRTLSNKEEALDLAERTTVPMFIMNNKKVLAEAYIGIGEFEKALQLVKSALELAEEKNIYPAKLAMNRLLVKIYKATGNATKALEASDFINKAEFEKRKENTEKAVADAETKYQTAEKEKEILQLEVKNAKMQKQRNYIIGGGLLFSLLGFFSYRFNKIKKDRNDKKEFAEALIFAQEEERKRIARDLHDGVGQSLLLIIKKMDNNSEMTLENQKMISQTLEEVRSISRDLHPFQLDKFGLTATITDMIGKIEETTEIFITQEIDNIDKVLDAKDEIHLFRTIQEAWNNIVKHSEAIAAKMSIANKENNIEVSIQDNGKGFDLELAVATSKSLGIRTMHERISSIGGQLKIEKGEKNGTHITITIPKKS